jgi:hypothetical protein
MPLRGECRPACKSVAVPPTQPRPWNVALCWKCDIDLGATGPSQPLRKFIDSHIVAEWRSTKKRLPRQGTP